MRDERNMAQRGERSERQPRKFSPIRSPEEAPPSRQSRRLRGEDARYRLDAMQDGRQRQRSMSRGPRSQSSNRGPRGRSLMSQERRFERYQENRRRN